MAKITGIGGVFFDDFAEERGGWAPFEYQMNRVLPGAKWYELDGSHPVFHAFFEIPDPSGSPYPLFLTSVPASAADPECTEWTQYVARGNYKIHKDSTVIQVQTDGAQLFNPTISPSLVLTAVSGSLRNFSGGNLNWTIEARCTDDVVCAGPGCAHSAVATSAASPPQR